jgi:hypothetical protein
MSRLAFMTFGILREPGGHPDVQPFFDTGVDVFVNVDVANGFIDRYRYPANPGDDPFGTYVAGRFVTPEFADRVAPTLSLWKDLEAVFAFAYAGVHADALRRRKEWFAKPAWPVYAAWWVADDHRPDWREASTRLEHLHDHGATSYAFDFRSPFGADGHPASLDRTRAATLKSE